MSSSKMHPCIMSFVLPSVQKPEHTVCRIRIQESEDGRVRYHRSIVYIISSTCQRIQLALQIMEESRGSDTACSRPRSPTSHCSLASVPVPVPGKNRRPEQEDSITRGVTPATPQQLPRSARHGRCIDGDGDDMDPEH